MRIAKSDFSKKTRRVTALRRVVQAGVLLAFVATARWSWTILGAPVLSGTLSASEVLGVVPLADPFATLCRFLAGHAPAAVSVTGAVIAFTLYGLLGSRTFCGWVCPVNAVTETAAFVRNRLKLDADTIRAGKGLRYAVLAASLVASAAFGIAAFEVVSPQALLWRDLVFGSGLSALAVAAALFAVETALWKDAWCGHLCPLGAFWSLTGKLVEKLFGRPGVVIAFDNDRCTRCGDCVKVCPEPQIIKFKTMESLGRIPSGACLNCARCSAVCDDKALRFAFKAHPKNN